MIEREGKQVMNREGRQMNNNIEGKQMNNNIEGRQMNSYRGNTNKYL
jgi:hypothetical protein